MHTLPFKKTRWAIFITTTIAFFCFLAHPVFAENAATTSMTVSPMSQEFALDPGKTYEGNIQVVNLKDATTTLKYSAKVGSYSRNKNEETGDDYGGVDVETRLNTNQIVDWITLDKDGGEIEPGDQDTVHFTIKVPKNAPGGAQYASILITNETDIEATDSKGHQIKNKTQMASAILTNVAGTTIEKAIIKENNVPSILTTNTLEATSLVKNEGNVYANAKYTLQVWPLFSDEEICTNEEEPESSFVLPETERYHVQTCNLPMVGVFKVKQVVSIFNEKSITEKTIIICPVWLMVLILIIIVGIVIAVIISIKKHKKKD